MLYNIKKWSSVGKLAKKKIYSGFYFPVIFYFKN